MPKAQSTANLIPVVEIAETHFVTLEGRVGVILEAEGRNMSIMSAEEAEELVSAYADVLNYLDPGVHFQLVVSNKPLSAEEWVPVHMRQYDACPPHLTHVRDTLADRYRERLAGRHIPNLRYHLVLTVPGAPAPKGKTRLLPKRTPSRVLLRDRRLYEEAVAETSRVAHDVIGDFASLGITAEPLGRQASIDLLRSCMSPQWSEIDRVDASKVSSAVYDLDVQPTAHAATMRQLTEVLAVGYIQQRNDYMVVDGGLERTIALRTLPDSTFAGYLDKLVATGRSWRASIHIDSLDKRKGTARLRTKHRQLHGVLEDRRFKNRPPDVEAEERQAEIEGVLAQMNRTDLRTFRVSAFVTVRADSRDELKTATREVIAALSDAGGTMIDRCITHQVPAWVSNLPGGNVAPEYAFPAITTNLADTFPFLHHRAGTPTGPLVGFSNPGRELTLLNPWHSGLPNYALAAVGKSGSGKTMFGQHMAFHSILQGYKVVVLDRSNGHWDSLVDLVGGTSISVSLDGSLRINPWELRGEQAAQYRATGVVPQRKVEYLLGLLTLMVSGQAEGPQELTPHEKGILERGIREVYEASREPVMSDLQAYLRSQPDAESRSLAGRISPYVGCGVYAGLLDGPTSIPPAAALEVFNFADLSRKVIPLTMFLLLEHLWEVIKSRRQRTLFVMDEGWSLLRHPDTADFVQEVTRRGRHYGLSVLNMSQQIGDYDTPVGRAVIGNTSLSVLLAQNPSDLGHVQSVFELTPDERDKVAGFRKATKEGASAYLHSPEGAESGSVHLWVTPEEYWLFTSAPEPRDEPALRRAATLRHGGDVWPACRELAETDGRTTEEVAQLRPSVRPSLSLVE
ncbi:MAG: hypothetical protein M3P51_05495 [Chloroflexota bacterium]|nr:hypothetical protein [Chloroflexota bacterium]